MVVIVCDLDEQNMFLSVLENGSKIMSHYARLLKRI
jgi:hypothetical protein